MSTHYQQGVRVERLVILDLKANGYETVRAASSKGAADVVAIKAGQVLIVSCKRTKMPGPAERADLLRVADLIPNVGVPLVALKPLRQPLEYRKLHGPRASQWCQWSPDFAGGVLCTVDAHTAATA